MRIMRSTGSKAGQAGTLLASAALSLWCLSASLQAEPPGTKEKSARGAQSFLEEVRPILGRHCLHCHNSEKPKRGLDLSHLETLLKGGKSGLVVAPGNSRRSLLFQVVHEENKPHMPPKEQLGPEEIRAIGRWIDGLPADFASQDPALDDGLHWAFRKIGAVEIPEVKNKSWVRNPIDSYIASKLEENGLAPSAEAGKDRLLRRASLDILGLPPSVEELDAFLADDSPDAFEKAVDRILASPAYGERWARHWLDLARYAESEGFKSDEIRPNAWRYRDYVIRSFNEDKPYDRFVQEQIAGDELWPDDPEARIATGFNRHYPDESNARNLMQRRQEILNDITDTVGSVFTGLTYGCARCHNHKYDPISQADYYRLQAFFANVRAADDIIVASSKRREQHQKKMSMWEEKTCEIRKAMAAIEEPKRKEIADDNYAKFPPEVQAAISRPGPERTPIEWQMYYKALPYLNPDHQSIVGSLSGEAKKHWETLKVDLNKFSDLYPGELPVGIGICDLSREAPKTFLLSGGVYSAPKEEVEPGFLSIVDPSQPRIVPVAAISSTGRRTALSSWLVQAENPLTSRVMVNRAWHYHFGRGIVGTPSDFGAMGEPPSHRGLLDWLARELTQNGWSLKRLHRQILTSSTYRQSSSSREDMAGVDPQDRLLWRFPRCRLEGEVIRDAALSVAGLLNSKMGGPSVSPDLPAGMEGNGKWSPSSDLAERSRRSVYVFVRRNLRYPLFEAFDMPDTHESCGRRNITVTAPQALLYLNDKLVLEWARSFAARVIESAGANRSAQIESAYRIAYSRSPGAAEIDTAESFLKRQRALLEERASAGDGPPPSNTSSTVDSLDAAALADFCHVLINSNEFVYLN